jgi:hypothetical protein
MLGLWAKDYGIAEELAGESGYVLYHERIITSRIRDVVRAFLGTLAGLG